MDLQCSKHGEMADYWRSGKAKITFGVIQKFLLLYMDCNLKEK